MLMPQKSKENTAPQNFAEIPHLKLIATVVQHFHLAMLAGRARVMASDDSPASERKTLDQRTDGSGEFSETPAIALTFPTPAALAMSRTFLGGLAVPTD